MRGLSSQNSIFSINKPDKRACTGGYCRADRPGIHANSLNSTTTIWLRPLKLCHGLERVDDCCSLFTVHCTHCTCWLYKRAVELIRRSLYSSLCWVKVSTKMFLILIKYSDVTDSSFLSDQNAKRTGFIKYLCIYSFIWK